MASSLSLAEASDGAVSAWESPGMSLLVCDFERGALGPCRSRQEIGMVGQHVERTQQGDL